MPGILGQPLGAPAGTQDSQIQDYLMSVIESSGVSFNKDDLKKKLQEAYAAGVSRGELVPGKLTPEDMATALYSVNQAYGSIAMRQLQVDTTSTNMNGSVAPAAFANGIGRAGAAEFNPRRIALNATYRSDSGFGDTVKDAGLALAYHLVDSASLGLMGALGSVLKKTGVTDKNFWTETSFLADAKETHTKLGKLGALTGEGLGFLAPGAAGKLVKVAGKGLQAAAAAGKAVEAVKGAEEATKGGNALLRAAKSLRSMEAEAKIASDVNKLRSSARGAAGGVGTALSMTARSASYGAGTALKATGEVVSKTLSGPQYLLGLPVRGVRWARTVGNKAVTKAAVDVSKSVAKEAVAKGLIDGKDAVTIEKLVRKTAGSRGIKESILGGKMGVAPWKLVRGESQNITIDSMSIFRSKFFDKLVKEGIDKESASVLADKATAGLVEGAAEHAPKSLAEIGLSTGLNKGWGSRATALAFSGAMVEHGLEGALNLATFGSFRRFSDAMAYADVKRESWGELMSFAGRRAAGVIDDQGKDVTLPHNALLHDMAIGGIFHTGAGLKFLKVSGERSDAFGRAVSKYFRPTKGFAASLNGGMELAFKRIAVATGIDGLENMTYGEFIKTLEKRKIKGLPALVKAFVPNYEKLSDEKLRVLGLTALSAAEKTDPLAQAYLYKMGTSLETGINFNTIKADLISWLDTNAETQLRQYVGDSAAALRSDIFKGLGTAALIGWTTGGHNYWGKNILGKDNGYGSALDSSMLLSAAFALQSGFTGAWGGSFAKGVYDSARRSERNGERNYLINLPEFDDASDYTRNPLPAGLRKKVMPGLSDKEILRQRNMELLHAMGVPGARYMFADAKYMYGVINSPVQAAILKAKRRGKGAPKSDVTTRFLDDVGREKAKLDAKLDSPEVQAAIRDYNESVKNHGPASVDSIEPKEVAVAIGLLNRMNQLGLELPPSLQKLAEMSLHLRDTAQKRLEEESKVSGEDIDMSIARLMDSAVNDEELKQESILVTLAMREYMKSNNLVAPGDSPQVNADSIARLFFYEKNKGISIVKQASDAAAYEIATLLNIPQTDALRTITTKNISFEGDNTADHAQLQLSVNGIQNIVQATRGTSSVFEAGGVTIDLGTRAEFDKGNLNADTARIFDINLEEYRNAADPKTRDQEYLDLAWDLYQEKVKAFRDNMESTVSKFEDSLSGAGYGYFENAYLAANVIVRDMSYIKSNLVLSVSQHGDAVTADGQSWMDMETIQANLVKTGRYPLLIDSPLPNEPGIKYLPPINEKELVKSLGGGADAVKKVDFIKSLFGFIALDKSGNIVPINTYELADRIANNLGGKTKAGVSPVEITDKEQVAWIFKTQQLLDRDGNLFDGNMSDFLKKSGLLTGVTGMDRESFGAVSRMRMAGASPLTHRLHTLIESLGLIVSHNNRKIFIGPKRFAETSIIDKAGPELEAEGKDLGDFEGATRFADAAPDNPQLPDYIEVLKTYFGENRQAFDLIDALPKEARAILDNALIEMMDIGLVHSIDSAGLKSVEAEQGVAIFAPNKAGERELNALVDGIMLETEKYYEDIAANVSTVVDNLRNSFKSGKLKVASVKLENAVMLLERFAKTGDRRLYRKVAALLADAEIIKFKSKVTKGGKTVGLKTTRIKLKETWSAKKVVDAIEKLAVFGQDYNIARTAEPYEDYKANAERVRHQINELEEDLKDSPGRSTYGHIRSNLGLNKSQEEVFDAEAQRTVRAHTGSRDELITKMRTLLEQTVGDRKPAKGDKSGRDMIDELTDYDIQGIISHLSDIEEQTFVSLERYSHSGTIHPADGPDAIARNAEADGRPDINGKPTLGAEEAKATGKLGLEEASSATSKGDAPRPSAHAGSVEGDAVVRKEWKAPDAASRLSQTSGLPVVRISNMDSRRGMPRPLTASGEAVQKLQQAHWEGQKSGNTVTYVNLNRLGGVEHPTKARPDEYRGILVPVPGTGTIHNWLLPNVDTVEAFVKHLDTLRNAYEPLIGDSKDAADLIRFIGSKEDAEKADKNGAIINEDGEVERVVPVLAQVSHLLNKSISELRSNTEFLEAVDGAEEPFTNWERLVGATVFHSQVGDEGVRSYLAIGEKGSEALNPLIRRQLVFGRNGSYLDNESVNWALDRVADGENRRRRTETIDGEEKVTLRPYTEMEMNGHYTDSDGNTVLRILLIDNTEDTGLRSDSTLSADRLGVFQGDGDAGLRSAYMDGVVASNGIDPTEPVGAVKLGYIAQGFAGKSDTTYQPEFENIGASSGTAGYIAVDTTKYNFLGVKPAKFRIYGDDGISVETSNHAEVYRAEAAGKRVEVLNPEEAILHIKAKDIRFQMEVTPKVERATVTHSVSSYLGKDALEEFVARAGQKHGEIVNLFTSVLGGNSPMKARAARDMLLDLYDPEKLHPEDRSDMDVIVTYLKAHPLNSPYEIGGAKKVMQYLMSRIMETHGFRSVTKAGSKGAAVPGYHNATREGGMFISHADRSITVPLSDAVLTVYIDPMISGRRDETHARVHDLNKQSVGIDDINEHERSARPVTGKHDTGRNHWFHQLLRATETGEHSWFYSLLKETRRKINYKEEGLSKAEREIRERNHIRLRSATGIASHHAPLLRALALVGDVPFEGVRNKSGIGDKRGLGELAGDFVSHVMSGRAGKAQADGETLKKYVRHLKRGVNDADRAVIIEDIDRLIKHATDGSLRGSTEAGHIGLGGLMDIQNIAAGRRVRNDDEAGGVRFQTRGANYRKLFRDNAGDIVPGLENYDTFTSHGVLASAHRSPTQQPNDLMPIVVQGTLNREYGRQLIMNHRDVVMGEGDYDKDLFNYWFDNGPKMVSHLMGIRNIAGGTSEPGLKPFYPTVPIRNYNPLAAPQNISNRDDIRYARSMELAQKGRGMVIGARNVGLAYLRKGFRAEWMHNGHIYRLVPKYDKVDFGNKDLVRALGEISRLVQDHLDTKKGLIPEELLKIDHLMFVFDRLFKIEQEDFPGHVVSGGNVSDNQQAVRLAHAGAAPYRQLLSIGKDIHEGAKSRSKPFDTAMDDAEAWASIAYLHDGVDREEAFKSHVAGLILHSTEKMPSKNAWRSILGNKRFSIGFKNQDANGMPEQIGRMFTKIGNEISDTSRDMYSLKTARLTEEAMSGDDGVIKFLDSISGRYPGERALANEINRVRRNMGRNDSGMKMYLDKLSGQLKMARENKRLDNPNYENKPRTRSERFWANMHLVSGMSVNLALNGTYDHLNPSERNEFESTLADMLLNRSKAYRQIIGDASKTNTRAPGEFYTQGSLQDTLVAGVDFLLKAYGRGNNARLMLEMIAPEINGYYHIDGRAMPRYGNIKQDLIRAFQTVDPGSWLIASEKLGKAAHMIRNGLTGNIQGLVNASGGLFSTGAHMRKAPTAKGNPWIKTNLRYTNQRKAAYSDVIFGEDEPGNTYNSGPALPSPYDGIIGERTAGILPYADSFKVRNGTIYFGDVAIGGANPLLRSASPNLDILSKSEGEAPGMVTYFGRSPKPVDSVNRHIVRQQVRMSEAEFNKQEDARIANEKKNGNKDPKRRRFDREKNKQIDGNLAIQNSRRITQSIMDAVQYIGSSSDIGSRGGLPNHDILNVLQSRKASAHMRDEAFKRAAERAGSKEEGC